jgi:hypothetical protein
LALLQMRRVELEDASKYFGKRGVVTGNPIRGDFANPKKEQRRGEHPDLGGRGSRAINTAATGAALCTSATAWRSPPDGQDPRR